MNLEEARAQYYEGRNLNAGIIYVKALEAEVERLRERLPPTDAPWTLKELADLKAEVERLQQLNRDIVERYSEAAKKAEARIRELEEEVVEARR